MGVVADPAIDGERPRRRRRPRRVRATSRSSLPAVAYMGRSVDLALGGLVCGVHGGLGMAGRTGELRSLRGTSGRLIAAGHVGAQTACLSPAALKRSTPAGPPRQDG